MAADGAAAHTDAGLAPKGYPALVCTKADGTGGDGAPDCNVKSACCDDVVEDATTQS